MHVDAKVGRVGFCAPDRVAGSLGNRRIGQLRPNPSGYLETKMELLPSHLGQRLSMIAEKTETSGAQ